MKYFVHDNECDSLEYHVLTIEMVSTIVVHGGDASRKVVI